MLNQLRAAGPQPAIRQVRGEYDAYRKLDNQPGDRDPRPDFVEIGSSLGTTEVALDPMRRGSYGEIYGYTSRFESKLEPGKVTVFQAQHRSDTDGGFRASEAILEYGTVVGQTIEQKQDIITYYPLNYTDRFETQVVTGSPAAELFSRLEVRAQG